jgi:hypothetical protein
VELAVGIGIGLAAGLLSLGAGFAKSALFRIGIPALATDAVAVQVIASFARGTAETRALLLIAIVAAVHVALWLCGSGIVAVARRSSLRDGAARSVQSAWSLASLNVLCHLQAVMPWEGVRALDSSAARAVLLTSASVWLAGAGRASASR